MSEIWLVGDAARLSFNVIDPITNLPVDPNAVVLKVKHGNGSVVTQSYPGEVTRISVGAFEYVIPLTEKGRLLWRWESSTPYPGALQGQFEVAAKNI